MSELDISDELIVRNMYFVDKNRIMFFKKIPFENIHPVSAWPFILNNIKEKTSEKFIYSLGLKMGNSAAKDIYSAIKMNEKFIAPRLKSVFSLLPYMGLGKCSIENIEGKKANFIVRDNLIIVDSKEKYGKDTTTCTFFKGFYQPFIEEEIGMKVNLKKNKCVCNGDEYCEWIITAK